MMDISICYSIVYLTANATIKIMHKIRVGELNQYFSRHGIPDFDQETAIWMIDLHETYLKTSGGYPATLYGPMGMPGDIIDEATELSRGWAGWGFYTHRTQDSVYSGIPVLLFVDKEDAVMARLRWAGSPWVSMPD